jgi:peptidyl-prolyl cis-trans isomerase A (cyclophilin A)
MRLTAIPLAMVVLFFAIGTGFTADQGAAKSNTEKLINPALLKETAPAKFKVKFVTSQGEFIVEVTRAWAPNGADRFYNLVKNGYYDGCRFFRVVENFMVQFGINGDPKVNNVWKTAQIKDDPVKQTNARGYITYAKTGAPDSRTTQLFINFGNNSGLDKDGFAPFGAVTKGMNIVDAINSEYREKPDQGRIQAEGNEYLTKTFPKLDYIKSAAILTDAAK